MDGFGLRWNKDRPRQLQLRSRPRCTSTSAIRLGAPDPGFWISDWIHVQRLGQHASSQCTRRDRTSGEQSGQHSNTLRTCLEFAPLSLQGVRPPASHPSGRGPPRGAVCVGFHPPAAAGAYASKRRIFALTVTRDSVLVSCGRVSSIRPRILVSKNRHLD